MNYFLIQKQSNVLATLHSIRIVGFCFWKILFLWWHQHHQYRSNWAGSFGIWYRILFGCRLQPGFPQSARPANSFVTTWLFSPLSPMGILFIPSPKMAGKLLLLVAADAWRAQQCYSTEQRAPVDLANRKNERSYSLLLGPGSSNLNLRASLTVYCFVGGFQPI